MRCPEGRSGTLEYKGLGKREKRPFQVGGPKRQGLEFQNPFLKAGWAK